MFSYAGLIEATGLFMVRLHDIVVLYVPAHEPYDPVEYLPWFRNNTHE